MEREGKRGDFAVEEAIGFPSLDDGIACWRRRQKTQCCEDDKQRKLSHQKMQTPVRSNSTICPRSWNSRPWSHSSQVRLLGGTIGYKVNNRVAGLGLGSDQPWGTAEKAWWATEWPSSPAPFLVYSGLSFAPSLASPWDGDTKSLRQVLTLGI